MLYGQEEIAQALAAALSARGFADAEPQLMPIEPPREWGVTTNVCFALAGRAAAEDLALETAGLSKAEAKKRASELTRIAGEKLAQEIALDLVERTTVSADSAPTAVSADSGPTAVPLLPFVERVEAEGAYINFYYDAAALADHVVAEVLRFGADFGKGAPTQRRIMVEYAQPNTHKDFHVGHLRNAAIGQAIANLLEFAGNDIFKATYIGDVGRHVAVAIWARHTLPRHKFLFLINELESSLPDLKETKSLDPIRSLMLHDHDPFASKCPGCDLPWGTYYAYGTKLLGLIAKAALSFDTSSGELGLRRNGRWQFFAFFSEHFEWQLSKWLQDWEQETRFMDSPDERSSYESWRKYSRPVWGQNAWIEWWNSRAQCVEEFSTFFAELGIAFDEGLDFSEYGVERVGLPQKTAGELKQRGIAVIDESEEYKGALYVDFERHLDKFPEDERKRIARLGKMTILRSDGTSLYQTKELGLAKYKFDLVREKTGQELDESLYVVGAEQKLYFEQVFAILHLWGFPNADNCKHVSYELVVLPEGKMSSREGNVVSYRELRDEAIRRAEVITREKGIAGDVKQVARDVAIAAIKYAMLQVTGSQKIVFDFEQALLFDGRAAPYLQYAYARTRTLVEGMPDLAGPSAPTAEEADTAVRPAVELHPSEVALARTLAAFPMTCADAALHYEPATLCTYLYYLASQFAEFYRDCRVLDAPEPMRTFRRRLSAAFRQVMQSGFKILALPLPEEM